MRRILLLALGAIMLLAVACTPEEGTHLDAVNQFRHDNGLPTLAWDESTYGKAKSWSQQLADAGKLSHSNLSQGVPAGWQTLGENVAVAPTLERAMELLKNSPSHRKNLLNPKFTKVSIGVVEARGSFWVTEFFQG